MSPQSTMTTPAEKTKEQMAAQAIVKFFDSIEGKQIIAAFADPKFNLKILQADLKVKGTELPHLSVVRKDPGFEQSIQSDKLAEAHDFISATFPASAARKKVFDAIRERMGKEKFQSKPVQEKRVIALILEEIMTTYYSAAKNPLIGKALLGTDEKDKTFFLETQSDQITASNGQPLLVLRESAPLVKFLDAAIHQRGLV